MGLGLDFYPHVKRRFGGKPAAAVGKREPVWTVYFVGIVGTNSVKIGHTGNLPIRVKALRTATAARIKLLARIVVETKADAKGLENHIQRRLKIVGKHEKREWFKLTAIDIADIISSTKTGKGEVL
jgi:hypothetical protein